MNDKPNIPKAILISFLALIVLFVTYLLTAIIAAGLFVAISKIPFLNSVIGWIFYTRGDTPGIFTILLSATLSYIAATEFLEKLCKKVQTEGLSLILTGSYLLMIQTASLIINTVCKDPFAINIVLIISSISLIFRGKERM